MSTDVSPTAELGTGWFALDVDDVAQRLGVDPATGLSSAEAAHRLAQDGPNELPAEKPVPGWRQFLSQYRNYMQVILVAAAALSLVIGEFTTALVVFLITVLNAVVGLRQQGKADSAMNALKSMMQESARVRRDGTESTIAAQDVVVGDVVLLTAGDEVPADGRIVAATSLQIDESALTGESTPAGKNVATLEPTGVGVGDQSNMAFSSTPVTHGSAVMLVTGTAADTEVGKIAGMLAAKKVEKTPLMKQLDTLTLWIAGAAGVTMLIMFALGIERNQSLEVVFTTAIALAIAAIPEAMPTILQTILSAGSQNLAKHNAVVKDLGSVETLRGDVGDQLGQDRDAHHEPGDRGRSDRPDRPVHHLRHRLRAGRVGEARGWFQRLDRGCDPALPGGQRRQAGRRRGRRRPHRGCAAHPRSQGRRRCRGDASAAPAARHARVRPHLQVDGDVPRGNRRVGPRRHPLLRQRCRTGCDGPGRDGALRRHQRALEHRLEAACRWPRHAHGRGRAAGDGGGQEGPRPSRVRRRGRLAGRSCRTFR